MSLGRAMWLARVARKNPRRIPIADFSKRIKIRIVRIAAPKREYRHIWPESDIRIAIKMVSVGRSVNEISAELKRTPFGVRSVLRRHGVKIDRSVSATRRKQRKKSLVHG